MTQTTIVLRRDHLHRHPPCYLLVQSFALVYAQVAAAVEVSVDPALLLGEQVLPVFMPLSVGRSAAFGRVGAALQEPADPFG
jgi:hypothetical protein